MTWSMELRRKKVERRAGSFAAIEATSGIKGKPRFYDFRRLHAAWPTSHMPETLSAPTRIVSNEHMGRYVHEA